MKQGIPPTAGEAKPDRLANNVWQTLPLSGKHKQAWRITFLGGLTSHLSLLPQSCNQLTEWIAGFDFLSSNLWVQTAVFHWETEHLQLPSTSFIPAICAYKSGPRLIFKVPQFPPAIGCTHEIAPVVDCWSRFRGWFWRCNPWFLKSWCWKKEKKTAPTKNGNWVLAEMTGILFSKIKVTGIRRS